MIRQAIMAACFSVCAISAAVRADFAPASKALFMDALDSKLTTTPQGRAKLASDADVYCAFIEHDFPRNSPAEDQWLDGEIAGGSDRMLRAIGSTEFGRRRAAVFVSDCKLFGNLLRAKPDSSKGFAGLAFAFVRFSGDAEDAARQNKLDAQFYGFPVMHDATEAFLRAALAAP